MARAPRRRARTPSTSSESSSAPPQQQQQQQEEEPQQQAQSPYANSPTVRVNLHLPYDATPARGHRFSTLRVVADASRPPSHSTPDPSNSEGLAGRKSQETNKEKANRERHERALRRRSERSEAPSPPEESPWRMRRKELRAAKMAAKKKKQQQKEVKVKDEDEDAQNDEADGSAIGSSSAFKRRRREGRSTADVETGGGPEADQDVVGIDAALRTPAPKRAKRGAGKAETVSATTAAPDRALEGATSQSAAANPFDATSDAETVSNASDDGGEDDDGQAHKAADRRRSLVLLNAAAATRQESSFDTSQFNTNDYLPGSNSSDTGGEDVGQANRTIAHRSGHKNKRHDPRPAILGTISTRRFAAFEEEIPHTTTTTLTASSPRPPPTPPLQLNQSDLFREELDAIAADTTPPILRNYKFVHEVQDPASQQQLLSSSSSSPFSSVQNRRSPIYHMFEPMTGRFPVQKKKGEEKMMMMQQQHQHKKQVVKEQEILYEGRGQRRVSDGAQGLEFGKPPTPRKTKRRSRIVTMPLPLVVKKNYGGDQGDGQQK